MKNINSQNALCKIKELLDILSSNDSAIDLSDCITKLKEVVDSSNNDDIKIVLLGSFSDGKTSTIAGLLGEIMDNMKIDSDESSDELTIYRHQTLKKGFVIVDTPGLFGTKEKEIDGENVHFSDITSRYISEAHIVMYVTSAVAPIKDSHSKILKHVLRDLGKLNSTIFVLNKMDETGANIANEEVYSRMAATKKQFLIERLSNIISLTREEISKLKIVCISADPKRKGIAKWLETPEKYNKLSRITDLNKSLNEIVSTSDRNKLRSDAYLSSLEDVVKTFSYICHNYTLPLRNTVNEFSEDYTDMQRQLETSHDQLMKSKSEMFRQLDSYRTQLLEKIAQSSYDEMSVILTNDIGVEKDNVSFFVVKANTDIILNDCSLSNNSTLKFAWSTMESDFQKQDSMFKDLANKGIGIMKGVDNKAILAARDIFFKGYKFKPWGAVKFANGIGKAAAGLQALLVAIDLYGRYKRNKELQKTKKQLTDIISEYFAGIFALMTTEDDYLKNFAPSFLDMQNLLEARQQECDNLSSQLQKVENLKTKVSNFWGQDIEDADFVEL